MGVDEAREYDFVAAVDLSCVLCLGAEVVSRAHGGDLATFDEDRAILDDAEVPHRGSATRGDAAQREELGGVDEKD